MILPHLSEFRVLVVPGLHGSEEEHWQTRWEKKYSAFERVQQSNWSEPVLPRWSQQLVQALDASEQPTVIVAHSFGCLTTMHAASRSRANLVAALLVAPADPEKFAVADILRDATLPCPAIVISSSDDPWMASHRAAYWADRWSCGFLNAGALGHINAESGLGDWEQGLQQLSHLLEMARPSAALSNYAAG